MKRSRRFWLWLILLFAFALRLFRLGADSLWYDETVSVFLARQDLVSLTRHTAGDIHPPLYYYLLHFWGQLAGFSEFSSAFFSLFFGILLLALVYRVGRAWFSPGVALLAAFLVAVSPYNLWYSQEVRMYTLGAVLGLASVHFFLRVLRSPQFSRDLLAYAIVSAAGLYTLYYFAFLIAFEDLFAVLLFAKSQIPNPKSHVLDPKSEIFNLKSAIASQVAVAVLYLPWAPIAFRQATDPPVPPWRSLTPITDALLESFSALSFGQSVEPATVLPVIVMVAFIVGAALYGERNGHSLISPAFLLGYTFVPLVMILLLSFWKPLYHVRYVFLYSPAFYLLAAVGLDRISRWERRARNLRAVAAALVGVVVIVSGYSAYNFWFNPKYTEDDVRGAVRHLAAEWRPGDAILIDAGYVYTAFDYYYDLPVAWRGRLVDYVPGRMGTVARDAGAGAIVLQTGSIGGAPSLGWGDKESDFYATTADETRAALDRVFAAHPRVWLLRLYDTVVDPDGIIRDYLARRGRILDDEGLAGESYARVQGYATPRGAVAALPTGAISRPVLLGGRIALLGFNPETATLAPGTALDVNLYWQAKEPTNIDEHLFVGLFSQEGKLVASDEEIPLGNALGTSRWAPGETLREPVRLQIPGDAPSGNYILRVALFNPLTHEPMAPEPGEWVVKDNQIELTVVRIQE